MGIRRRLLRVTFVWVLTVATTACADSAGETCDALAGAPMLPGSSGNVLDFTKIDTEKAIPACQAAVRKDADDIPSTYRLVRALVAAERYADAMPPLERAMAADYGPAFAMLGNMQNNGMGMAKDAAAALASYRRAVELDYMPAAQSVAWYYATGTSVQKDLAQAARLYLQAAEADYAPSQSSYAVALMRGDGVERDEAAALEWAQRAAEQENGYGCYLLGFMHENGRGTRADPKQAVSWYEAATEAGDNFGRTAYARMLEEGKGVKADPARAREIYRDAAEAGIPEAQARLGRMLRMGQGGPANLGAARTLLERAGDLPMAQSQLGLMDWFGEAGSQDRRGGLTRIRKAADGGYAEAQLMAAKIMTTVDGGEPFRNTAVAVRYLRMAANQDQPTALLLLGQRLINGEGVAKNTQEGLAMLDKAAALGETDAANLAKLERERIAVDKRIAELQREQCELMIEMCNRGCEKQEDGAYIYNTQDGSKWFRQSGQLLSASESPDYGCPQ